MTEKKLLGYIIFNSFTSRFLSCSSFYIPSVYKKSEYNTHEKTMTARPPRVYHADELGLRGFLVHLQSTQVICRHPEQGTHTQLVPQGNPGCNTRNKMVNSSYSYGNNRLN